MSNEEGGVNFGNVADKSIKGWSATSVAGNGGKGAGWGGLWGESSKDTLSDLDACSSSGSSPIDCAATSRSRSRSSCSSSLCVVVPAIDEVTVELLRAFISMTPGMILE